MSSTDAPNPALLGFILRHVSPLLGERDGPAVSKPARGNNSEVYMLRYPSGAACVLRGFESRWALRRYQRAMRWGQRAEAPIPRLIACWAGPLQLRCWGRVYCLEEHIDGPLAEECDPADEGVQHAILSALARLHDITMPDLGFWRRSLHHLPRQPYLLGRALKYLEDIPVDSPVLDAGTRRHWQGALEDFSRRVPRLEAFSLVHHHLAGDDIIVRRDGTGAVLLDNGSLRFGHWGHDLEDVLAFLAADGGDRRARLIETYLGMRRTLPPGTDYSVMEPFFLADRHLKKLRAWVRKYHLQSGDPLPDPIRLHRDALSVRLGTPSPGCAATPAPARSGVRRATAP